MRDDCVMTRVHCPYEGAGCTFHVSYVMVLRFGIEVLHGSHVAWQEQ